MKTGNGKREGTARKKKEKKKVSKFREEALKVFYLGLALDLSSRQISAIL